MEKHPKILNFLSAIEKQQSEDQVFDSYQEVVVFLNEEAKKEELPEMAYYLLKHVNTEKGFRGLFSYFVGLGEGRGHSALENVLVNFVKECFAVTDEFKNKLILDVLLQAKASFI